MQGRLVEQLGDIDWRRTTRRAAMPTSFPGFSLFSRFLLALDRKWCIITFKSRANARQELSRSFPIDFECKSLDGYFPAMSGFAMHRHTGGRYSRRSLRAFFGPRRL
jgi:hypothetical protein